MKYPAMRVIFALTGLSVAATHPKQPPPGSNYGAYLQDASFDYVVVGGGTAGLTVATRLAQDGRYSVAVIEAGSFCEMDNGNRSTIPGFDFYSCSMTLDGVNPLIDWRFVTTPQPGDGNQSLHYIRGKGLGGSSSRNYLLYNRATVGTMAKWAELVDDQSWTWENVLPYYKRSATLTPPNMAVRAKDTRPNFDEAVFGSGPLQVGFSNYGSPFARSVMKAFAESGDQVLKRGMQSGELLGHDYVALTVNQNQERSSSQTSYGNLAFRETSLTVYVRTLAKKILFDNRKTVTGVQVETGGLHYNIHARREVILSAGAIQSPQLLLVSGVGPAEVLKKHKIPVIHDLPGVGQNFHDNPLFGYSSGVNIETTQSYLVNPALMQAAITEYNDYRTGLLTTSGADAVSFQKLVNDPIANLSAKAKKDLAWVPDDFPDVEYVSFGMWLGPLESITPAPGHGCLAFGLLAPVSRGYVTIESSDMADKPIIVTNTLKDETDQEIAVAAVRKMRKIMNTKAMRDISVGEPYPRSNVTSYHEILDAVKRTVSTYQHAAGTCKMGTPHDDPMTVVDSKARVVGVHKLRVVDLSAIPFLPPGQPQASVYMLAEKAADEILYGGSEGASGGHDEL